MSEQAYVYGDGGGVEGWAHQCKANDTGCFVLWATRERVWYLWDDENDHIINYCPFCGLELPDMPEVRE